MSTKVHGTTRAQAREPGRRDNGLANDVRVSPTDEGPAPPQGRRCDTKSTAAVPFYPTADECSELLKTWRDQEARFRRRLSRGEPICNETITPLSVLEFRTVQRVLTGRLQPRPIRGHGDASVFGPNDADRRAARLSCGTPVFTNEPLQFEATTITRAHHPRSCMTIRIRGLPASFGISKPIAGRMTTAFAGTRRSRPRASPTQKEPSTAPRTTLSPRTAANHKPVVNPSAVAQGPSTARSQVVLRRAGSQPVRLLGEYGQGAV